MVDKQLSGGERKRIELAAVLALNPRLVILDEPTAGIDLLSIHEIMDLILTFKQRGTTVLLISHREELVRMGDRASQLAEGRIVFSGDAAEVATHYRHQPPITLSTKEP
jgi:Fe-S cluster assembly ATP-binding protein